MRRMEERKPSYEEVMAACAEYGIGEEEDIYIQVCDASGSSDRFAKY